MSNVKLYSKQVDELIARFRQAHAARLKAEWEELRRGDEQATKTQAESLRASRAPGGRTQALG